MQRVGAPQSSDIVKASGDDAIKSVNHIQVFDSKFGQRPCTI